MLFNQPPSTTTLDRPSLAHLATAKTTAFGTLSMYDFSSFTDPRLRKLAEALTSRYLGQFELTSREYLQLADSCYDEAFSRGVLPRPLLTELLQLIVNTCIYQAAATQQHFEPSTTNSVPSWFALLYRWGSLLPTHTLRDTDKNDMQQFSTPPEYALIAAWCCQPTAQDVFCEPSAGLAGLAAIVAPWVKATVVNEYDHERVNLLRQLPAWNEVLQMDAAMMHLHPFAVTGKPTLVLMNPPFSYDRGERDRMTAARHIESMLSVLEPGGRLVAILPGGIERSYNKQVQDAEYGMAPNASTFRSWWQGIQKEYTVRANIGIEGAVYKKFGTATRTRLVIIDKIGPQGAIETITTVSGKTWIPSPLLLLHDNDFTQGVVMARQRMLSPAEKEAIKQKQLAVRLDGMGLKTRERFGVAAAVPEVPKATTPVTLVTAGDQRGQVEQMAARILFTLGLGGHLYEHEQFHVKLDRGHSTGSGLMDLVIERQLDELFFTHWFEQGGDLCRDSEVRFLAPLDSGLLKLSGITGWGPRGEFTDECSYGSDSNAACRDFAKTMLGNVKHFLQSSDVDKLTLTCDDWKEAADVHAIDTSPECVEGLAISEHIEEAPAAPTEMMDVFHGYRPFVTVTGSKPHNVTLVESNTMRLAQLPIATAQVHLPKEAVELGHISSAQLENVVYAVHAHEQFLRDGATRKGYLIGDGTGVGKGTEAASVAMHYYLKKKGRVRIVWVSKEFSLVKDAIRDWKFIGGDENFVHTQDKLKDQKLKLDTGILFTTYTTMSMRGSAEAKANSVNRLLQLTDWLNEGNAQGMDTLLLFDESHLMGNATTTKGERGDKKASQRAVAGMELMSTCPATRVLFLSATAATEVHNLGYAAERLGLCGKDVAAFPDLPAFISNIHSGGMLAMELVAKDMKAMGLYNARSLSYEGTSFRLLEHKLTEDQTKLYNEACYFWRLCYDYMKKSFDQNGTDSKGKAMTMAQFWGGAQRFFNQMLTSIQTPAAIDDMLKELATGHSIVVQLVNTNEAATNRVVAEAIQNEVDLDELDITPRDMLLQLIRTSYPTVQYQKQTDDNGNTIRVPMKDKNGDNVQNPQAVEMRDDLLLRVAEMRVPEGALDMLIDRMDEEGFDVAEITGRSRRFVMRTDSISGKRHRIMEPRSKRKGDAEAAEFMAGKRRVLVFSGAGNTGRSFQSDLRCQNQQRRKHYVLQAGWRADEAIQGLGRTHRTNQANAPEYVLPTTDLPGQKRFITSIARRIEQLGSLTRGNRAAAANDMFKAEDNLETSWAKDAVNAIFMGLYHGKAHLLEALGGDIGFAELCDMMGLNTVDEDGNLSYEKIPGITQFLNRMLFLPTHLQHSLFTLFDTMHMEIVENARAEGLLDLGVEKIRGDEITKVKEQLVHADKDTGARTHVVQLDVKTKLRRLSFDEGYYTTNVDAFGDPLKKERIVGYYLADNQKGVNFSAHGGFMKFIVNNASQRVYSVWQAGTKTDTKNGNAEFMVRLVGPTTTLRVSEAHFNATKHRELSPAEARQMWDRELYNATDSDTHQEYLVTGAVLPVWEKLGSTALKVRIMVAETTDTHERILGRLINAEEIDKVMVNLGVGKQGVYLTSKQLVDDVLNHASILHLSNAWQIRRRRLSTGINSLVLIGPSTRAELAGMDGVTAEVHGRDLVYVVATPENEQERLAIFNKLTERRKVVRIAKQGATYDVLDKEAEQTLEKASQLEKVDSYSFDDMIVWHDAELLPLAKEFAAHVAAKPQENLFEQPIAKSVVVPAPGISTLMQQMHSPATVLPEPELTPVDVPFEVVRNPAAVDILVETAPEPVVAPSPLVAPTPVPFEEMSAMDRALYVARHSVKKKAPKVAHNPQQISLLF